MQEQSSTSPTSHSNHFSELQAESPERTSSLRSYEPGGLDWNGCPLPALDWNGYRARTLRANSSHVLFRKEVIQPQVLLRLPCYDFTPIMSHTLGRCLPCGSALQTSSTIHFRDVTGGVYKARERIHGSVLICHY